MLYRLALTTLHAQQAKRTRHREAVEAELQASQVKAERDKAEKLQMQLLASRQETAWLRQRIFKLQQSKHARDTAAAQAAAALSLNEAAQRQPLQQQQQQIYANFQL